MLNTPVLFLIFNRPEITARVFQEIRKAKPKQIYIAADGPRIDHPDDPELCNKTRQICESIDWDCEVMTLFREENLGCQLAVSNAIDWFFEHESEGIILEDDCLPSQSFFYYCAELLDYYRDDMEIMCVSGDNFQQGPSDSEDSYYFSRYPHCWGWATWRRAWNKYDHDMSRWREFRENGGLNNWSDGSEAFKNYWTNIFDKTASNKNNSWAFRWTFSCWFHDGLTCLPSYNLVKNIGFTDTATHTTKSDIWYSDLPLSELALPLSHPKEKRRNIKADKYTDRKVFGIVDEVKKTNTQRKIEQFVSSIKRRFQA